MIEMEMQKVKDINLPILHRILTTISVVQSASLRSQNQRNNKTQNIRMQLLILINFPQPPLAVVKYILAQNLLLHIIIILILFILLLLLL